MDFSNYKIIPNIDTGKKDLFTSTLKDIQNCEKELNIQFENDYKEYVLTYGRGILGGTYIRIYLPNRILSEINEWRERINEYWFWNQGKSVLKKEQALESIIIGDTFDGDEIIYYHHQYYILPRYQEMIYPTGKTLEQTIEWLCSAGILTEAFTERNFEPY